MRRTTDLIGCFRAPSPTAAAICLAPPDIGRGSGPDVTATSTDLAAGDDSPTS